MTDSAMLNMRVTQQTGDEPLETAIAATEEESVLLAEKLTQVAIPLEVLMQALNIAKYDKAAAFRYADQYLNKTKKRKWILIKYLINGSDRHRQAMRSPTQIVGHKIC
ncbi:hypothetical protein LC593_24850 [Nostoc sp. CHAB 5844]|nr:hypothetical protein [Nostoc sp. CHAB 5844]